MQEGVVATVFHLRRPIDRYDAARKAIQETVITNIQGEDFSYLSCVFVVKSLFHVVALMAVMAVMVGRSIVLLMRILIRWLIIVISVYLRRSRVNRVLAGSVEVYRGKTWCLLSLWVPWFTL